MIRCAAAWAAGSSGAHHQEQHARDVGHVRLTDGCERLLVVVRLVGQPQARLGEVHEVAARVVGVGVDVRRQESRRPRPAAGAGHLCEQPREVGDGADVGEVRLERPAPPGLDGLLVHERGVEVADLGPERARRGVGGRRLDDRADIGLGRIPQGVERPVGGSVGRDLVLSQPAAVEVAEQVVLDADGLVDVLHVDAGGHVGSCAGAVRVPDRGTAVWRESATPGSRSSPAKIPICSRSRALCAVRSKPRAGVRPRIGSDRWVGVALWSVGASATCVVELLGPALLRRTGRRASCGRCWWPSPTRGGHRRWRGT